MEKRESKDTGSHIIELIQDIADHSENLTKESISILNPYKNERLLRRFAKSINYGEGITINFSYRAPGMGEIIQGEYVAKFLRHFFPKAKVVVENPNEGTYPDSKDWPWIEVVMKDFQEVRNAQSDIEDIQVLGTDKEPVFSMVQTKIIHSFHMQEKKVNSLRTMIFDLLNDSSENEISHDRPLIVGTVVPESMEKLNKSLRYLHVDGGTVITSYIYNPKTGKMEKEGSCYIFKSGILRFLSGMGDYCAVPHNKNKLEGVYANSQVIVDSDNFHDIHQNPNASLDNILHERGMISSINEMLDQPLERKKKQKPPDIQNIHDAFLHSSDNVIQEPPLKESMASLFNKMAENSSSQKSVSNITSFFNRLVRRKSRSG